MKKTFLICLVSSLLGACADSTKPEPTMETRFNDAHKELMKNNFGEATAKFEAFEKDYPASLWSASALINGAYSAYMDKDYLNAMMLSDKFLRFHPGNQDLDYVLYLRGMIAFDQVSDIHREQSMSKFALTNFNDLVTRFPNSIYTKNAQNKINILRNQIAGKQLNLARRQMKIENFASSITILQDLVDYYSDTATTPEALYRLYESYNAFGMSDKANEFKKLLQDNYPNSTWAKL